MNESKALSERTYLVVFALLALLLVATVAADRFDFGPGNLIVAMAIAVAKAMLIAAYFMHLRFASAIVRIAAAGGLLWLALLMTLTLADYATRPWDDDRSGGSLAEHQMPSTFDASQTPEP